MTKTILALGKSGPVMNAIVNELLSAGNHVSIVGCPERNAISQPSLVKTVGICSVIDLILNGSFETIFLNLYGEPSTAENRLIQQAIKCAANKKNITFLILRRAGRNNSIELSNPDNQHSCKFAVIISSFIFEDLLLSSFKTNIHLSRELLAGSYGISAGDIGRQIDKAIKMKNQFNGITYFVQGPEKIDLNEVTAKTRNHLRVVKKPSLQVRNLFQALTRIRCIAFFMRNPVKAFHIDKEWNELGKPQISVDGFLNKIA
jgi:hypothetical protein